MCPIGVDCVEGVYLSLLRNIFGQGQFEILMCSKMLLQVIGCHIILHSTESG